MTWVKIRVPRTSQPQDTCGIDWSNPITQGLLLYALPSSLTNAPNFDYLQTSSVGTAIRTAGSQSVLFPGNFLTPKSSVLVFAKAKTKTNPDNVGVVGDSSGVGVGSFLKITAAGLWRFSVVSGGMQNAIDTTQVSITDFEVIIGAHDGVNAKLYRQGVEKGTVAAGNATGSSAGAYAIGASIGSPSFGGDVALFLRWDRGLSPIEVKSLSDNPWQIFEPEEITIWIPDTASPPSDNLTPKNILLGEVTISAPSVGQNHVLLKKDVNLSPLAVSTASIQQFHQLTASNITTGSLTISKPILSYEPVVVNLIGKNVNLSALTINNTVVGQVHSLTPQVVNLGSVVISKPAISSASNTDNLIAKNIALGSLQVTKPSISQLHILAGLDVTLDEIGITKSAVGQTHVLQVQPITLSSVVISKPELTSLANTDVLYPKDITLGALTVSNPVITQVHTLVGKSLVTGSVSVVNPIFRQVHGLTPKYINLGSWKITKPILIIGGITEVYVDEILSDVVDDKVIVLLQDEVIQVNILSETI